MPKGSINDLAVGPEAGREEQAAAALRIFAALWAVAVLFHYAASPWGLFGLSPALILLSAIGVLLRPSSLPRFLVMVGLQAAWVAYAYPEGVTNHWLFTAFVNVTILAAAAWLLLSRRRNLSPGHLFLEFAPVVRVELLVLYFFAVLHKLNFDFLNPEISCATELYTEIASAYFLPAPHWLLATLPFVTLAVETAIPLLLCFRRTRVAGVALGVLFHAGLAISPAHTYFDFSSMLYATYFLFLPYDFVGSFRAHWSGTWIGQKATALWDRGVLQKTIRLCLFAIAGVIAFNWMYQELNAETVFAPISLETLRSAVILVWSLYAIGVVLILLRAARSGNLALETRGLDAIALRNPLLAVIPLLILFNGLNPYLGLKTENSFSMFSNLRTEGGHTNHLFIPSHLQVAGYQSDLVQIVDSSDRGLKGIAEDEHALLLTYMQFKQVTARKQDASVTYVRNGELRVVPRVGDDPELSRPEPFLLNKLLNFRFVDTDPEGFHCTH